jgi:hypothetical protein
MAKKELQQLNLFSDEVMHQQVDHWRLFIKATEPAIDPLKKPRSLKKSKTKKRR